MIWLNYLDAIMINALIGFFFVVFLAIIIPVLGFFACLFLSLIHTRRMTAPSLDASDIARLREIAEKATPGPWKIAENEWNVCRPPWREAIGIEAEFDLAVPSLLLWTLRPGEENAAHIAAFDPPTVLALLDALEQAQKERDEWQAAMVDWTGPEATKALLAQRDAAQQSAQDARALLREAVLQLDYFGERPPTGTKPTIRSRIEAELRK